MKYDQDPSMIKKESSFDSRVRKTTQAPEYVLDGESITLMTGPYMGKTVQDIWNLGEKERDYVYKWVYRRAPESIRQIIKRLFV
ncbi:hypothetical protein N8Z24_00110 [bacterium]|nr:hypothetical protein [bacterium]